MFSARKLRDSATFCSKNAFSCENPKICQLVHPKIYYKPPENLPSPLFRGRLTRWDRFRSLEIESGAAARDLMLALPVKRSSNFHRKFDTWTGQYERISKFRAPTGPRGSIWLVATVIWSSFDRVRMFRAGDMHFRSENLPLPMYLCLVEFLLYMASMRRKGSLGDIEGSLCVNFQVTGPWI